MKRIAAISTLFVLLLLLIGTLAFDSGSPTAPPARPDESGAEPPPVGISAPETQEAPMPSGTPEETVKEEPAVKAPRAVAKKLELEGQVPDELLGEGDATLTLRLISSDTGQPVASSVRLWRLGVPAGGGRNMIPGGFVGNLFATPIFFTHFDQDPRVDAKDAQAADRFCEPCPSPSEVTFSTYLGMERSPFLASTSSVVATKVKPGLFLKAW